ncbi:MAG: V-type ATP synthase subunit F, partial [Candidatus Micrarchaeota archaeon]|nr:V-type ATP synthase subunit F [Candidatus Micrarchaeota archaeon]
QKTFEANGDIDAKLAEALHTPGLGILIISSDVFGKASAKVQREATESAKPVVVVIPEKGAKKSASSANLAAMVKRAIGVDILK